jgi:hypothetical protein
MDEDEVLRQDRAAHPDCTYSTTSSQMCSSVNGSFVCEVLKQIQRNCPGKRPENIFYSKTVDDAAKIPDMGIPSGIQNHFGDIQDVNPFNMLGDLLGKVFPEFGEFSSGPADRFEDRFSGTVPVVPPHKLDKYKADNPGHVRKDRIAGPIEKI